MKNCKPQKNPADSETSQTSFFILRSTFYILYIFLRSTLLLFGKKKVYFTCFKPLSCLGLCLLLLVNSNLPHFVILLDMSH